MGLRFNPPPGWPRAPEGYTPPPGWQPDPSWPPAPPGWQLWVNDDQPLDQAVTQTSGPEGSPYGQGRSSGGGGNSYGNEGSAYDPGNPYPYDPGIPYGSPGDPYDPGNRYDAGNQYGQYDAGTRYDNRQQYDSPANLYQGPGNQYGSAGTQYDAGNRYEAENQYGSPGNQYDAGNRYEAGNQYGSPGAPYGAGSAYGAGGPYQRPPGTSGWAVASFVLGLIGGVVLGAIFGFIALSRIKRLGQGGRGLAIAGIVLSACWTGLLIIAIIASNLGQATRSPTTGQITHSGKLNVFSLAVGDCFNNPAGASSVTEVTAIPCTQPHNAQIFAKFDLTGSDFAYPGTTVVTRKATVGCNRRIGSVDKAKTTSAMSVRLLFPEDGAWIGGQRTVSCMIVNPQANITSSLLKP